MQEVHAQSAQLPVAVVHYALDSFTTGKVLMKSGATYVQKMNYNIITSEMIFESGGKFLAIAAPQEVDTVFLGQRRFVPVEKQFYEWLTGTQPALFKEYGCSVREPGMEVGYGATSSATASAPLRQLIISGGAYALKLPDDFKVTPKYSYWVQKETRFYKLNNAKNLVNLYPAKKHWINEWWKNHDARFSKEEDLIALVAAMQ
jgi:hypothetical protein